MAASGYTPIQLYYSTTASAVPTSGNLLSGELAININDGKLYFKNSGGTVTLLASSGGALGDVVGPASATDTAVALFDGTTGKLLKNSAVTIGTTGNTVISGTDNSNAMLRITQLGTGNALLVEDSANPDSTPFVVDANGKVISGSTTTYAATAALIPQIASVGNTNATASMGIGRFSADVSQGYYIFTKSRSATLGTLGSIVSSGDAIGTLLWTADDGTNAIQAASITALVDGTPATNDMPGRLVFSTTASGASTPTERMRIDNAGSVGIGSTSITGYTLRLGKNMTGGATSNGLMSSGVIQSDVTSNAIYYRTLSSTQATAFTLPNLYHYYADQSTIGAGSTVSNQYGFFANSTLTGATNNFGFYSNIASGTGRWNFYANGTADNYFAGSVGIGATSLAGRSLAITKTITGATTSYGILNNGTVQSDVTSDAQYYNAVGATAASAFTLTNMRGYYYRQATIGATSAVTNQYGFFVESDVTGATNNYGFYSNIASGTGRWNFYANGTADNFFGGSVAIGGTATPAAAGQTLRVGLAMTGVSNDWTGVISNGQVRSGVTANAYMYRSSLETQAAAFTLTNQYHYHASQSSIGAGSAVTNQYGFVADSTLTGATNNYGFYSGIASGTGRWNFYANGTAANYFGGNTIINGAVGIGTAGSPSYGTSGQVLTSQGSGSPPVWAAASSSTSIGLVRAIAINCILP